MNQVCLIGRIVRDAEIRYTADKKYNKVEFTMAVTTGYGDKAKTSFIPIEKWQAEKLQKFLTKGTQVAINGELHIERYEDKQGNKKTFTKVVARDIALLGSKSKDETSFTPPGFEEIDMEVPF